jgi:hypothetical protein
MSVPNSATNESSAAVVRVNVEPDCVFPIFLAGPSDMTKDVGLRDCPGHKQRDKAGRLLLPKEGKHEDVDCLARTSRSNVWGSIIDFGCCRFGRIRNCTSTTACLVPFVPFSRHTPGSHYPHLRSSCFIHCCGLLTLTDSGAFKSWGTVFFPVLPSPANLGRKEFIYSSMSSVFLRCFYISPTLTGRKAMTARAIHVFSFFCSLLPFLPPDRHKEVGRG